MMRGLNKFIYLLDAATFSQTHIPIRPQYNPLPASSYASGETMCCRFVGTTPTDAVLQRQRLDLEDHIVVDELRVSQVPACRKGLLLSFLNGLQQPLARHPEYYTQEPTNSFELFELLADLTTQSPYLWSLNLQGNRAGDLLVAEHRAAPSSPGRRLRMRASADAKAFIIENTPR